MKNLCFAICTLASYIFLSSHVFAQNENQEKKVIVSYTWSRIPGPGSNQIAIWMEDTQGNHVASLFATRYTATGAYIQRPVSLSERTAKFDLKNASKEQVDAITGSTHQSGVQTVTWNCRDKTGNPVTAGTYVVRMGANIRNAEKMFFRGEITIGGTPQQTNSEITYSSPGLASGNVLFKDVL